jgi:MFS family permease
MFTARGFLYKSHSNGSARLSAESAHMAFQPAGSLTNRTFVGLIVAQFLAGFNDQAIHAMAMFYAINTAILSEGDAISLMPILFFAPWAIFATVSGYLADRHSKTYSLIGWKISEIVISLVLITGFYLGTNLGYRHAGGWIVMSAVFLMGTHAAFFAPAKYGAMPEILQAHVLSRGNGILESTTFLASILGTVAGGFLSFWFRGSELWIGFIMLGLALVGAAASFLIAYLPPSNPTRPFPVNLVKPLLDNFRLLFRSRPLALSVVGIAFFVFMVAYMRGSVYMHGESRNPRWDEFYTSLIVATVALGVGVGSPLAGYLSGGKVELGLVPLGCLGMIAATFVAGLAIEHTVVLVLALIVIGFFSGFYMVPLYTLLQHRAPKTSKGDLVATSNFFNVTGAIIASVLFKLLVWSSHVFNVSPLVPQTDVIQGRVIDVVENKRHQVKELVVQGADPADVRHFQQENIKAEGGEKINKVRMDLAIQNVKVGDEVVVTEYDLRGVRHFIVRGADQEPLEVFDYEVLPRFLFIIASVLALGILLLLWWKLPDFFVRTLFWLRSLGRYQIREVGLAHLPTSGPVMLATNCDDLVSSLQLVSVTDRTTKVILLTHGDGRDGNGLLLAMARRWNLIELPGVGASPEAHAGAIRRAEAALAHGHLLAVDVDGAEAEKEVESLLDDLRRDTAAPVVPVYCGNIDPTARTPKVRVVFGDLRPGGAPLAELRAEIERLGTWIRQHDDSADLAAH